MEFRQKVLPKKGWNDSRINKGRQCFLNSYLPDVRASGGYVAI